MLSCDFRPLVEFSFVLWGEEALPEDLTDIASHLENFGGSEPMPSWLIEIADMLAEYKDDAKIIASRYRECLKVFYRLAVVWLSCKIQRIILGFGMIKHQLFRRIS